MLLLSAKKPYINLSADLIKPLNASVLSRCVYFSFFIPNINLKTPLSNFGLFTTTIFIAITPLSLTQNKTAYDYYYRKNNNKALGRETNGKKQPQSESGGNAPFSVSSFSHTVFLLCNVLVHYIKQNRYCYNCISFKQVF